jgi:hypothetical protein
MNQQEDFFLEMVNKYVFEHPEIMPKLISVLTDGIKNRLSKEQEKRAEIESCLAMALARRSRSADGVLASKLENIQSYSMFSYKSVIGELSKEKSV